MHRITKPGRRVAVLSGFLLFLAGCSAKPAAQTSVAAAQQPPVVVPVTVVKEPEPVPPVESPSPDALPKSIDELNRRGYLKDVFFDYDQYAIRADQREILTQDAAWLKKEPTVKILVEGHCDERGTASYNMALGERRAEAMREYLQGLGVASSRVQIVSYGKERPFDPGNDERAWAQNRRDHVLATAE
jgi:peptidoglycan-associated lipoprotein